MAVSEAEFEKLIEAVMAARSVENARRMQGGRDRVPSSFMRIVEDYKPRTIGDDFDPSPLSLAAASLNYETIMFGRTRYIMRQRDFLDALTAIARRDRRIAELEHELGSERALRMGTFRFTEPG